MNIEQETSIEDELGFETTAEDEPQTPEDQLHAILEKSFLELKEASLEDIQSYEQQLVDVMKRNDHSAKTFLTIAENFPTLVKKKLRNQEIVREQTLNHIVDLRRLCHERFAKAQKEFEERQRLRAELQAEQERLHQLQAQALQEESEQREAWSVLERADTYGEERYQTWVAQRQALDQRGRPRELVPEHQAFVDKIDAKARRQSETGNHFHEISDRLERGFGDWIKEYEIFGTQELGTIGPVNKYDDITKHIDVGANINIPGVQRPLGIDFSVNGYDTDLARKVNHGLDIPIERTTYRTQNFSSGQEFITLVLTLDDQRAQRLLRYSNFRAVMDESNQVHRQMAESFEAITKQFHDREILQYTVVEEALAQLQAQLADMEQRELAPEFLSDHHALIAHLTQLLEERKNLREVANAESSKEAVRSVYRTRDPEFIRSVAHAA